MCSYSKIDNMYVSKCIAGHVHIFEKPLLIIMKCENNYEGKRKIKWNNKKNVKINV